MRRAAAAVLALGIVGVAGGAIIYQPGGPFGGMLGLWGLDGSSSQSAGALFSHWNP